ncbi:Hypothetical predicted protein [Pelobates cultripes]|uniref:Reverse transcriptase domain-containing protein n=1 Tax=Pelobates cultripes TaxID=61616 RepID=A0AAD1RDK1_PELCU|nr:Hypothetical predicted protein [Pelobates cultripes]
MAPMYANGYMFEFETQHILEPFKDIILSYGRYIDDIFMIIKGDNSSAESMVQYINSCTPNVQLTMTMDPLTVDFLDVVMVMTPGRVIERDAVRLQTYVGQPAAVPVRASMESDVLKVW